MVFLGSLTIFSMKWHEAFSMFLIGVAITLICVILCSCRASVEVGPDDIELMEDKLNDIFAEGDTDG